MPKLDLTYDQITQRGATALKKLIDAGVLTAATGARCGRIGRFVAAVGEAMPNSDDVLVGDVFSEQDLRKIWKQTAAIPARMPDLGPMPTSLLDILM